MFAIWYAALAIEELRKSMKEARKKKRKSCGTSPCICLNYEGERSSQAENSNQSAFPSEFTMNADISQEEAMKCGSPYMDFANSYYNGPQDTDRNNYGLTSQNYVGLGAALDSESKLSEYNESYRKSRLSLSPRIPRAVDYYVPNPNRRDIDTYKLPRASLAAARVGKRVHVKTQTGLGGSSSSDESFSSEDDMLVKNRLRQPSTIQPNKFTNVNVLPGMPAPPYNPSTRSSYLSNDSKTEWEERQRKSLQKTERNPYEERESRSENRKSRAYEQQRRSTQRNV